MIPKRLQAAFDANGGYAKLGEFSIATGLSYGHSLKRVQAGEIPAVNVAAEGSRAQWRLYEEPIRDWFAERQNKKPSLVPETEIPNYYDDAGNWIASEDRRERESA